MKNYEEVKKVNIDKIKAVLLYFSDNVKDPYITKILKMFYYLDFISFSERGSSVTNDIYYKLPYGPIPTFIKNEIDTLLINENESQLKDCFKFEKTDFGNLIKLKDGRRKAKDQYFSQYEKELMDLIIEKIGKKTTKKVVEKTHSEKPYLLTEENGIISYGLALLLNGREVLN